MTERRLPPSAFVLILANAMPLAGVLFLHWSVFAVLLLYWSENVIVGVFNVLRMLTADPGDAVLWIGKAVLIPFFCVHYGMFTYVHGQFVLALFGGPAMRRNTFHLTGLVDAVGQAGIWPGVAFLALSQLVSFVHDWIMSGECRRASIRQVMFQPYARVMILHFTILVGGFIVQLAGAPVLAVALLVTLKTAIDLRAHLAERAKLSGGELSEGSAHGA